jgi:hypothetical protein
MAKNLIIAVDFDGTIVEHRYPEVGKPVPGAIRWMKEFRRAGAKLILWTMRSPDRVDGTDPLRDAVEYCRKQGVEFFGVNENPEQRDWTSSPKAYAHVYIDGAAFGCPLRESPRAGARPYVDWDAVGPAVLRMIVGDNVCEPTCPV